MSFSERDGPAGAVGAELLAYAGLVFDYWHGYKDGSISRATFQAFLAPVRERFEDALRRAVAANIRRLSGSCKDILEHAPALWNFVDHDDVEPTNNHAERELRAFVLWRKRCFGSQSERGNLFAERLMTIAHTARKQDRDVLSFLTACCRAYLLAAPGPSLVAAPARSAAA